MDQCNTFLTSVADFMFCTPTAMSSAVSCKRPDCFSLTEAHSFYTMSSELVLLPHQFDTFNITIGLPIGSHKHT